MKSFRSFIKNSHTLLLFISLEVLCLFLISRQSTPLGGYLFNLSSHTTAQLLDYQTAFSHYTQLEDINQELLEENKKLQETLLAYQKKERMYTAHSSFSLLNDSSPLNNNPSVAGGGEAAQITEPTKPTDSSASPKKTGKSLDPSQDISLEKATLINNNILFQHNFLMIDKGSAHGIRPGMGIVNHEGVVGKVKHVSQHFSTAYSLLHTDYLVSVYVKSSHAMGSVIWTGVNPYEGKLSYLSKHTTLKKGDTLMTTGFGNIYPRGMVVGYVKDIALTNNSTNYIATFTYAVNFQRLYYVYVVKDPAYLEKDSLLQLIKSI